MLKTLKDFFSLKYYKRNILSNHGYQLFSKANCNLPHRKIGVNYCSKNPNKYTENTLNIST